ncbi:MAG TPA: hypothetical protein VM305_10375 [Candidatus Limnocylindrales bacterium]|nr:hypothetical protein [Candidatus Limnocylindrales bacterium]
MPRHARLLLLLAVVVTCLAVPASPAAARESRSDGAATRSGKLAYPDPPRPGYSPRHVRQLLNNCAFASAQMLVDKWTHGRKAAPQHLLRRATGIPSEDGGPTLAELRRAVARVSGVELRWSPNGGDPLTWPALLTRLENGGGALVNLWPEKLPRHYVRWIPALTAGHSVYIERYQHAKNRIWLMDPLGRGSGFGGEWIDADALHRAIWKAGDLVWAAATPPLPPRTPAISDFELGAPDAPDSAFAGDAIEVAIAYAPRRWDAKMPTLRVAATWQLVAVEPSGEAPATAATSGRDDPAGEIHLESAALGPLVDALRPVNALIAPRAETASSVDADASLTGIGRFEVLSEPLGAARGELRFALRSPEEPGDYLLTLELRDGTGEALPGEVPTFQPSQVRLRGPLAGRVRTVDEVPASIPQGERLSLDVKVRNLGSAAWGEAAERVVLVVGFDGAAREVHLPLALAAGQAVVVPVSLAVDVLPGQATLQLALRDGKGAPLPEAEPIEWVLEITPAEPGTPSVN